MTAAVAPPRTVPRSHAPPRAEPSAGRPDGSTHGAAAQRCAPKLDARRLPSYDLVHEVRVLRSLVEGQLAGFAFNDLKRRDRSQGRCAAAAACGGLRRARWRASWWRSCLMASTLRGRCG